MRKRIVSAIICLTMIMSMGTNAAASIAASDETISNTDTLVSASDTSIADDTSTNEEDSGDTSEENNDASGNLSSASENESESPVVAVDPIENTNPTFLLDGRYNELSGIRTRATNQNASEQIQNKNHWCWATAAGMVGVAYNNTKGYSRKLSTNARVTLNYTDNIRYSYIGYNNGALAAHGAQRTIVVNQFGNDKDNGGSDGNKIAGIKYASNATDVRTLGGYNNNTLTSNISTLNSSLAKKYWAIGNVYTSSGGGHSILITDRNSSNQYWVYDPWTGKGSWMSYNTAFVSGFNTVIGTAPIKWTQYIAS